MVYMRAFVFFCFAIVFMLSSLCGAEASGQASSGAEVDASVPSCDASAGLANPGMYPYDNQLRLAWNLSEWIEGIKSGTGRGTDASKPDRLVASLDGKTLFHVCVGEKYGFIDKQGRMVINPQFDMALATGHWAFPRVWLVWESAVTRRPASMALSTSRGGWSSIRSSIWH